MPSARIRNAMIGDAEQIAALITELGYATTPSAMKERLTTILTDSDYSTFVAETRGNVVGVAGATLGRYYERDGIYSRLVVLAVSPTARGLGIGRQLVQAIERWSVTKGAHEAFVNSGAHRVDAHSFYERCGYARTGLRFVKQLTASSPD